MENEFFTTHLKCHVPDNFFRYPNSNKFYYLSNFHWKDDNALQLLDDLANLPAEFYAKGYLARDFILNYFKNYCKRLGPNVKYLNTAIDEKLLQFFSQKYLSFTESLGDDTMPKNRLFLVDAEIDSKSGSEKADTFSGCSQVKYSQTHTPVFNSNNFTRTQFLQNYADFEDPSNNLFKFDCDKFCLGFSDLSQRLTYNAEFQVNQKNRLKLVIEECDYSHLGDSYLDLYNGLNNLRPVCEVELGEDCF